MKKNLKINNILMITIITLFIFVGCSNNINKEKDSTNDSAKVVVENYFKYQNEKDKDKMLTTLTQRYNAPNVVWGFENLKNVKLLNIEEETDENVREGYLTNGMVSINKTTKDNLKVFKVKYEINYKKDGIGPKDSGTYDYWYFVIRKDSNSPWLIDDMGV